VSAAVLPLWANPELASMSPDMAQRIISILTKCTKGTERVTPVTRPAARQPAQPDPATVQRIVDMGFTPPRAEEALRRVIFSWPSVQCCFRLSMLRHPSPRWSPVACTPSPHLHLYGFDRDLCWIHFPYQNQAFLIAPSKHCKYRSTAPRKYPTRTYLELPQKVKTAVKVDTGLLRCHLCRSFHLSSTY
jgi:hypothetical protein